MTDNLFRYFIRHFLSFMMAGWVLTCFLSAQEITVYQHPIYPDVTCAIFPASSPVGLAPLRNGYTPSFSDVLEAEKCFLASVELLSKQKDKPTRKWARRLLSLYSRKDRQIYGLERGGEKIIVFKLLIQKSIGKDCFPDWKEEIVVMTSEGRVRCETYTLGVNISQCIFPYNF